MLFHTPELQKSLSSSQDYEDQVNQLVDLLYLMQADPPQIKGRAYYNLREIITKARSLTALLRCQRGAVYEVDTSIKVGDAYDNTTMTKIRPMASSDNDGSDGGDDDAAGGDGGDGSDGGDDDAAGGDGGDGSDGGDDDAASGDGGDGSDGGDDDAAGGDGGDGSDCGGDDAAGSDGGDSGDGGDDDAAGGDGGDGSRRPRRRKKELLVTHVIANAIVKRPAPKSPQVYAYLSKARVTVLSPE